MTLHIILVSALIISAILTVVLALIDDNSVKDLSSLVFFFFIVSITLLIAGLWSSADIDHKLHYRKKYKPTIEDINNGYAEIIEYNSYLNGDTISFYDIKWLGNNQDGERDVNYK